MMVLLFKKHVSVKVAMFAIAAWIAFFDAQAFDFNSNFHPVEQIVQPIAVGHHVEYYIDEKKQLSIFDIMDARNGIFWTENTRRVPNFGYINHAVWLRYAIENRGFDVIDRVIEVGYPLLDTVEFYLVKQETLVKQLKVGDQIAFDQRTFAHRNFLFEVNLDPSEQAYLYLRVMSSSSVQIPLRIASEREYFLADQKEIMGMSLYYGMMFVMLIVNLFMYVSLREAVYIYYIMFVVTFATTIACLHGLPNQLFWPNYPHLQDLLLTLVVPMLVLFSAQFARQFLSLAVTAPLMDKLFKAAMVFEGMLIVATFFLPYHLSIISSVGSVIPVSIALLLIGPYLWRKGHVIARFYTAAWLSITIAAILMALNKFGIIPRTFLTENGLQIGSALEAILLSLALVDRVNREREDRILAEEKIIYDAHHSRNTDLPNLAYLETNLASYISNGVPGQRHWMVLIDLCRFHEVHKTFGHLLADELLEHIINEINLHGARVPEFIPLEVSDARDDYYVAGIEGETFVMVVRSSSSDMAAAIVKRLIENSIKILKFKGMNIDVGATAGLYLLDEKCDIWSAIRNAQIGVDQAISDKQQVIVFNEDRNPYSERKLTLAGELGLALKTSQLEVYFQPKISVKTREVVGAEVLLRWNHEEYGFVPPDEFVMIAEQTGLINELTDWVIEESLMKLVAMRRQGIELNIAINISPVNLKQLGFADRVGHFLGKYLVSAEHLSFELTETEMMDDPAGALQVLERLDAMGVKLSIDDFGTGYSSLTYIKNMPVSEIKIDRTFVMGILDSASDSVIVDTTITMCHGLGYSVVAEGVESWAVCEKLQSMGCDVVQGYYFCRPIPFAELLSWLSSEKARNLFLVKETT